MLTENERYEYEKIITELYSRIASQNAVIEKFLAYMDEIKVDCMPLRRRSLLIMDDNNPMIKMEKLSLKRRK